MLAPANVYPDYTPLTWTLRDNLATARCPFGGIALFAVALASTTTLVGCGAQFELPGGDAEQGVTEFGQAAFPLTAETPDKSYALRNAQFSITGQETLTLDATANPDAPTLVESLESGAYSVELHPGYQLVEVTPAGDVAVDSTLETPNPQSIVVAPSQTTQVTYLFRTAGVPLSFGPGELAIAIEVERTEPPGLVLSEFMVNPSAVSDSAGEWIELANTSEVAVSLQGCRLLRDGSGFTIEEAVSVPPHGFLTLANGSSPGFTPGYVYDGLTLPNSASFTLTLECAGTTLDSVAVDPATWPLASGISAALSGDALSPSKNDAASSWCLSTKTFSADFGTPGEENAACAH